MSGNTDHLIRVRFDADRLRADLIITPGTDASLVCEQQILGVVTGRGIPETDGLRSTIAQIVGAYAQDDPEPTEALIATGTPAEQGECGRFELDAKLEEVRERAKRVRSQRRSKSASAHAPADGETGPDPRPEDQQPINHYDQSTLLVVDRGQHIGRVIPATPGTNGTDVCGKPILGRDGLPCALEIDEASLELDDDGNVRTKLGGLVLLDERSIRVTETLEIHSAVDFSTGHVDFRGDIDVYKGVCDMFRVTAGRSLRARGTVEAAVLRSGVDTTLERGMTGREKGTIATGRDLHAKYLDATHAAVGRDMVIDRELTNCTASVARHARCESAVMIGGVLTIANTAEFAQLGSESGTRTVIKLGRLERLEPLLAKGIDLYERVAGRRESLSERQKQIQQNQGRMTGPAAEELTEIQFSITGWESRLAALAAAMRSAAETIGGHTACRLVVHQQIMPGTEIHAAGRCAIILERIRGPLTIECDDRGRFVFTDGAGNEIPDAGRVRFDIDPDAFSLETITELPMAA